MMEEIVHCRHCGHENPAKYRFCGMCGRAMAGPASLPSGVEAPAAVYRPDLREPRVRSAEIPELPSATSISGPSFLGLGDQSSTPEFGYLLEDEPRRGPGRVLVALIIIGGLAAAGWWQVRQHGGREWLMSVLRNPKLLTQAGKAEDRVPADRLSRSQAALLENTTTPNTSTGTDLPVQDHALAPKAGESPDLKDPGSQTATNPPNESSTPGSSTPTHSRVDDSNTRVAEKYLYGQGVRQDCGRALSLLRPAADASNPKARTLLGTMYATGHCVPRDLPSSYRWFALALRQQPNNVWVSRNLQSVWNQMSDSERQTAMRMTK